MSRFHVLHLSDLHLDQDSNATGWVDDLVAAIQTQLEPDSNLVCVLSGDIANRGNQSDYEVARAFVQSLFDSLASRVKPSTLVWACVPGNHDVDFSCKADARDALMASNAPLENPALAEISLSRHGAYLEFAKWLNQLNVGTAEFTQQNYTSFLNINFGDCRVRLILLNSTIATRLHEVPGHLVVPVPGDVTSPAADVVVAVLHHPPHWLNPENRRALSDFLNASADIVLTGHEHRRDQMSVSRETSSLVYVEAGAFSTSASTESEFRLIGINVSVGEYNTLEFARKSERDIYRAQEVHSVRPFRRNSGRSGGPLVLTTQYVSEDLESVGVPLVHPRKQELLLSDIYQVPDFCEEGRFSASGATSRSIMSGTAILQYIEEHKNLLIAGGDRSGKTSLSKYLQRALQESGLTCLRLDGTDISSADHNLIRKLIFNAAAVQFGSQAAEMFLQLRNEDKALVVDDFHRSAKNQKARAHIAGALRSFASRVILISGNTNDASSVDLAASDSKSLHSFARCTIVPFGDRLREALVRRWHRLGQDSASIDEERFEEEIRQSSRSLDEIIGKNLVVPHPFELLAILQSNDRASLASAQVGSLGRAYEAMITLSLLQHGVTPNALNTWYTYLSNFAYWLYNQGRSRATATEFTRWHHSHEERYAIHLSIDLFRNTLRRAGILTGDDTVAFKYRYVFCFFVANYLSEKVTDANVQSIITRLLDNIDQDDAAHVMAFLCFSSNDSRIHRSLIAVADQHFAESPELAFESASIGRINELATNIEIRFSAGESPEENRQKELANRDSASLPERLRQADEAEPAKLEIPMVRSLLDFASRYRAAFRLVSIIGQTLRSHAGSLEAAPKEELASAAFRLGLRSDAARLSYADSDYGSLVARLQEFIKDEKSIGEKHAEILARCAVYFFCVRGTLNSMVSIAEAVASRDLAVTLGSLATRAPTSAHKMINAAIALEHRHGLDIDELQRLRTSLSDNRFAVDVLRSLVANHLYVFRVRQAERQRASSLFEIDIRDPNLLNPSAKRL